MLTAGGVLAGWHLLNRSWKIVSHDCTTFAVSDGGALLYANEKGYYYQPVGQDPIPLEVHKPFPIVFDYASLYPSIMFSYNLNYETQVPAP